MVTWMRSYNASSGTFTTHGFKVASDVAAGNVLVQAAVDLIVALPSIEVDSDTPAGAGTTLWGLAHVDTGSGAPSLTDDSNTDAWIWWGMPYPNGIDQWVLNSESDTGLYQALNSLKVKWQGARILAAAQDFWLVTADQAGNANAVQCAVSLAFW